MLEMNVMYEADAYKFREQIRILKGTLAPTNRMEEYLDTKKEEIRKDLLGKSRQSNQPFEMVLLVALCGELTKTSDKKQQAEFASRLILLDILTEQ
jgi:hypothetical protein